MALLDDNSNDHFLDQVMLSEGNTSVDQGDVFWSTASIDETRWNQVYPYQFLLVKKTDEGYTQDNIASLWKYTLPFPPESLQISMPFAINGSVTQGGFIEEHNGAPIRMITLSGTLGVLPLKGTGATLKTANFGQAIFGGSITQAAALSTAVQSTASNFSNLNPALQPNLVPNSQFIMEGSDSSPGLGIPTVSTSSSTVGSATGYAAMQRLQRFFERYAAFKKTSKGRDYRLAFAMWKDQSIYLVTPLSFNASRTAASPFEYMYNISLKAWRRINITSAASPSASQYTPAIQDSNVMFRLLSSLSSARQILENSRDILSIVGGPQKQTSSKSASAGASGGKGTLELSLYEPMRQVALFAKDILSVPLSFADLPVQIINNSQDAIVNYVSTQQSFNGADQTFAGDATDVANAFTAIADLGKVSSNAETGSASLSASVSNAVQSNLVGTNKLNSNLANYITHPAFDILLNPHDNYDFFNTIQPGQVNAPPSVIRAIAVERANVRQLTRLDFENMRDSLIQVQDSFADAVGAGDATYNSTFQRPAVQTSKQPTMSDFEIMFALNQAIMALNPLAVSGLVDQETIQTIDYVAGLASRSGIAFTIPTSKFAVPFPYGATLEGLSQQYLGDPDRWMEIVALNGLMNPYVDEEGFTLPLLVDGNGNQVVISDPSNLVVGQLVQIGSNTVSRTSRHVTKINIISPGNVVLTLDGDPTLDVYSTLNSAYFHTYLPNTVNSQQIIYIPSSDASPTEDLQLKEIPGINHFDQLLQVGGVDLLLTSTNDLAITPDGDCKLAIGLANIIQTARIRLSVVQGTLNRHPTFGLPIQVGQSLADINANTLLKAVQNLFNDDPTFVGVQDASVMINGPTTQIGLGLLVAGQQQKIPITLSITPPP